MSDITRILEEHHLLEKTQSELNQLKKESEPVIQRGSARLYPGSLYRMDDVLHCIVMEEGKKQLLLVSRSAIETAFEGSSSEENGLFLFRGPLSKKNALVLHDQFPFTAPVSLRQQRTTVGFGDRLGLASAAHLRVVRQFDAYPVLAQQSVRELNFTQRDFEGLVADATFLVFQEGYEDGWGADGDHLKNFEDIDAALNAKTGAKLWSTPLVPVEGNASGGYELGVRMGTMAVGELRDAIGDDLAIDVMTIKGGQTGFRKACKQV